MHILIKSIEFEHIDVTTAQSENKEYLLSRYMNINYIFFSGKGEFSGSIKTEYTEKIDYSDLINKIREFLSEV